MNSFSYPFMRKVQRHIIYSKKKQNYYKIVLQDYSFNQMVTKSIFTLVFPHDNFNRISKCNVVLIRHRILMNLCNLRWKRTNKADQSHTFMVFKEIIPTNNNNFILSNSKQNNIQQGFKGIRKAVHNKVKS